MGLDRNRGDPNGYLKCRSASSRFARCSGAFGLESQPQWHEIARLDHRFERSLSKVTAQYERRDDGGVRVINRGFDAEAGEWKEAEGRAYFVGDTSVAHLKVSFFGPFYASYVVFGLDENYEHAFVSGPDHDYLWLLAREPEDSEDVWQSFLLKAEQAGFDTGALIRP